MINNHLVNDAYTIKIACTKQDKERAVTKVNTKVIGVRGREEASTLWYLALSKEVNHGST
jgi:hypothetical protein